MLRLGIEEFASIHLRYQLPFNIFQSLIKGLSFYTVVGDNPYWTYLSDLPASSLTTYSSGNITIPAGQLCIGLRKVTSRVIGSDRYDTPGCYACLIYNSGSTDFTWSYPRVTHYILITSVGTTALNRVCLGFWGIEGRAVPLGMFDSEDCSVWENVNRNGNWISGDFSELLP